MSAVAGETRRLSAWVKVLRRRGAGLMCASKQLAPRLITSPSAFMWTRSKIEGHRRMTKVNLEVKLSQFSEYWAPRTVAQFNGHDVMVVKSKGEFVWHSHPDTDDFFLVLKGRLKIELRDQTIELGPGELFVVPKGVEHRPVADEEVHLLLIEPAGTPNTGDKETAAARRII